MFSPLSQSGDRSVRFTSTYSELHTDILH